MICKARTLGTLGLLLAVGAAGGCVSGLPTAPEIEPTFSYLRQRDPSQPPQATLAMMTAERGGTTDDNTADPPRQLSRY